jgi:hypothetical protein
LLALGLTLGIERMAWTDERLDDAFERAFNELRELRMEMRDEFRGLRAEIGADFRAVRSEAAADRRQQLQISWLIIGILLTQVVVYALTH